MASTSHSGQIRNSGSPSVIALSSAKAPSAAAAKPRFRSRTGCWTCRRRKVKCDERGRNPETVAYAGPLSSSSGCKRCEDSGRPCHGYGAQAPSGPLNTQYSSSNLRADPSLSSAPFYSFSSHAHEPAGNSIPYLTATANLEAAPCPIPTSMQWNQSFEQPLAGSQNIGYGLRVAHHAQPSSGPTSTSVGGCSLAPLPPSNAHLPSVDLRRFSVPSYPTWQRPSQPRNTSQYTSGGIVGNALFQSPTEYDHIDPEVPLTNSCASETPRSSSHPNDSTVLPAHPYRPLGSNDPSSHYNHDHIKTEPRSLSFEFGRPHTSSGVSSSYDDRSSHQNYPETYHSSMNLNLQSLKCIGESEHQYPDCPTISSTAVCSEVVTTSFLSEQQTNPPSLVSFRPTASTDINQPVVSPAHNPLFPSQVNDSSNYHPGDGFQGMGTTNIPIFHDIPYDIYAGHHSLHTKSGSREGPGSQTTDESLEQSFHLVQMDASSHQNFAEIVSPVTAHEHLRSNCSYIRSCPLPTSTENEQEKVLPRKGSSSSSSSSLSTQDHNVSPVASTIRHSSVNHSSPTTSSLALFITRPLSWLTENVSSTLPGMSDKWSSSCFVPSLETRHYDFQSILHNTSSECQNIGAYEDDSPTSTAPSNMSGAAGGN